MQEKLENDIFFSASCNLDNPLCMTAWVTAVILAVVYILYKIIMWCKPKPEDLPEFNPEIGQVPTLEQINASQDMLKPPDQQLSAEIPSNNSLSRNPSYNSVTQMQKDNVSTV